MHTKKFFLLITILTFFGFASSFRILDDHEIRKATLLEKITRFLDWDGNSDLSDKCLCIGFEGDEQYRSILRDAFEGNNKISNLYDGVKVVRLREDNTKKVLRKADILYIAECEDERLQELKLLVENKPVLTVCEKEKHFEQGIMVRLFSEKNKVTYELNSEALRNSKFHVDFILKEKERSEF